MRFFVYLEGWLENIVVSYCFRCTNDFGYTRFYFYVVYVTGDHSPGPNGHKRLERIRKLIKCDHLFLLAFVLTFF